MSQKEKYLLEKGWVEVPAAIGTCWRAPVTLTGIAHYFALDAAYALESSGEGVYSYSTESLLSALSRAEDVAFMQNQENKQFQKTGIRSGVYPNY